MSFKRARSEAQKHIRMQQITEATLALLETMSLEAITLKAIAEKLDFSRNNLYKYVSSKEEIYLLILENDLEHFTADVAHVFQEKGAMSIDDFCHLWAEHLYAHPRLLESFARLNSVIERNVTLDALVAFKHSMNQRVLQLTSVVQNAVPTLSTASIFLFLRFQTTYASGLYTSTLTTAVQREAIAMCKLEHFVPNFVEEFSKVTSAMLVGLIAAQPSGTSIS